MADQFLGAAIAVTLRRVDQRHPERKVVRSGAGTMPSWNLTVRLAPFEAAPGTEAKADVLDSAVMVVLMAGSDEPSAAAPAARCRKCRRGSFMTMPLTTPQLSQLPCL